MGFLFFLILLLYFQLCIHPIWNLTDCSSELSPIPWWNSCDDDDRAEELIWHATRDACCPRWFGIILHPPAHHSDLFSLAGLSDSEEMKQVAVETKYLHLPRRINKIRHNHGYQGGPSLSIFITKFLWDVGGKPQWQTSYTSPEPLGGGLALCWWKKGCWAEVTLPATHTMSIVSGLISSASLGFLALYLFFFFFPLFDFLTEQWRGLTSDHPCLLREGQMREKGELSPGVSPFVAERELDFVV